MKNATALLILKDPEDLQIYGTILSSLGYVVVLCDSYDEGINALTSEAIDLIVVSPGSQDIEARTVLQCAAHLHPRVPILAVARRMSARRFFESLDVGSNYLECLDIQDLMWTVAKQVGSHRKAM